MSDNIHFATVIRIYFIGIGGIGISALARYFLTQNWLISGSDVVESIEIKELRKEGIKVKIGHKKSNIRPNLNLVVYSQAIPADNPEFLEAKRLGIPLKSYPEALGSLTRRYKTIAIAGSHGKSTTTALTALVFMTAGLDPTVIVGTKLEEFGGKNFRLGKSDYLIIEADEYKDSFLNYYPESIIVTNVDREHLDYYKNFRNVKKGFQKFMNNLAPNGVLILNKDDKPLSSLTKSIKNKKVTWFSFKDTKHVKQIKKILKIPGAHNLSNALGVFKLAKSFGIKENTILKALAKYRGAWRRMEYKGKLKGVEMKTLVFDDYAHHPTEIKATLKAFREKFPKSLLMCIFQPHQSRRLKILFKEFTGAFDEADVLVLLNIYKVSGRDELSHNVNSGKLAKTILKRKNGPKEVRYLPSPEALGKTLIELLQTKNPKLETAVIVMMGAGDIVNLTPKLLK